MPLPAYRFVEVEWLDAVTDSAWQDAEGLPSPARCLSRGWLTHESESHVVVSSTISEITDPKQDAAHLNNSIAIPRGMVKRIRRLKVG